MRMTVSKHFWLIFLGISLALAVQLIRIDRPYFGHFSSYQNIVMASIARNMLRENFTDLLHPKMDLLINGQKALSLIYYPLPSLITAAAIKFLGGTFEFWGRAQAVFFNLINIFLVGLLGARLFNRRIGSISLVLFALSPMTLIYGQCFMLESLALCFLLLSFLCISFLEPEKPQKWLALTSALCFSVAAAERVHFVFLYPALALYFLFSCRGKKLIPLLGFSLMAFSLPALWHVYAFIITMHASNVIATLLLQVGYFKVADKNYLLDFDYYRLLLDIFSGKMLTPLFFPFFLLGFWALPIRNKTTWITFVAVLSGFLIAVMSPLKIIEQDFYLYGVFPFAVLITAAAISTLSDAIPKFKKIPFLLLVVVVYFCVSARYFLHPIFKYPAEDKSILSVAKSVQTMTKPGDKLIVAGEHPVDMFYYADRPVFGFQFNYLGNTEIFAANTKFTGLDPKKLKEYAEAGHTPLSFLKFLKSQGADYFLANRKSELEVYPELSNYLRSNFTQVSSPDDDFLLVHLVLPAQ